MSPVLLSLALLARASAHADPPEVGAARAHVEAVYTRLGAVVRSARSDAEARSGARQVLAGFVDYRALGLRTVAERWTGYTPTQGARFLELFRRLVERRSTQLFRAGRDVMLLVGAVRASPDGVLVQ